MALMWIFVVLLAVGVGLGVWAIVRSTPASGRAAEILAERLARGDITPQEYLERLDAIGGRGPAQATAAVVVAAVLIVLGLVGGLVAATTARPLWGGMGRLMDRMMDGGMMGGGMDDMMGGMGGMMGGEEGRDGDAPDPDADREVLVVGDEFSFDPEMIRLRAGETINVTFRNDGRMFHTFTVRSLGFELRTGGNGRIEGAIDVTEPGTYQFLCTVPGHASAGMRGRIVVDDA